MLQYREEHFEHVPRVLRVSTTPHQIEERARELQPLYFLSVFGGGPSEL